MTQNNTPSYRVPFKTPADYFTKVLEGCYDTIDFFKERHEKIGWKEYDCDLHIYPHTLAQPAVLSVGCPNQCPFCPSAAIHKGKIHFGNPEIILPKYANTSVHFMDENFFYNDMKVILPLLKKRGMIWLAMSDYKSTVKVLEEFGEDLLYECGLRVVEVGLENVVHFKKVKEAIPTEKIEIYYLNMTCLPGETKESIRENAKWMYYHSLEKPIHFNNGLWYACGQFFHPYQPRKDGRYLDGGLARVRPSWIPNTLLNQDYEIKELDRANLCGQLVYGRKIYNPKLSGSIGEFIGTDQELAAWLLTGIRVGAIK